MLVGGVEVTDERIDHRARGAKPRAWLSSNRSAWTANALLGAGCGSTARRTPGFAAPGLEAAGRDVASDRGEPSRQGSVERAQV